MSTQVEVRYMTLLTPIVPLQINGADGDIVDAFTFFRFGDYLLSVKDWHHNINSIITKAQQRLYCLRKVT